MVGSSIASKGRWTSWCAKEHTSVSSRQSKSHHCHIVLAYVCKADLLNRNNFPFESVLVYMLTVTVESLVSEKGYAILSNGTLP